MKTKDMTGDITAGKQFRKSKVLLVMEEPEQLNHHSKYLRAQGLEVFACRSYKRGLDLLNREVFDFIAVSQGGVAFEGSRVVQQALETDRTTPVLVLTRAADMKNYLEAMQLGAVDYLEMPVPPAELVRVLRTHLRFRPAA